MIWIGAALAASVTLNPGDDVASLTSSLGPGDEVVFNEGVYELESRITWSEVLGTESSPVTIRGEGEVVIEMVGTDKRLLVLQDSSWVSLSNLSLRGGEAWQDNNTTAIEINGGDNISVQDCLVEQFMGLGVYIHGDTSELAIVGNEIREMGDNTAIYAGCGDASCWMQDSLIELNWIHGLQGHNDYAVYIDHGGQGNAVLDNVIYDGAYRGILVRSTEFGEPNVVEGNAIWGLEHTALYAQGAAVVRNNLVFNTGSVGLRASDPGRGTYSDLVFSHNTVVDTGEYGIQIEDWAGASGMVLANNAVSNPTGYAMYAPTDEIDEDNFVVGNVATGLVQGFDHLAGHFEAGGGDRDFVDAPGWDFYPSSDSYLLGAGETSGSAWVPETDFNGAPRDGAGPDVGAYERVSEDNPGWAIQEGFKEPGYDAGPELEDVGGGCCSEDGSGAQAALVLPLLVFGLRRRRDR